VEDFKEIVREDTGWADGLEKEPATLLWHWNEPFRVPWTAGNFSTRWTSIIISRSPWLREI